MSDTLRERSALRAHYATTTPFYAHVASALRSSYSGFTLQRRFQLERSQLERIDRFLPSSARAALDRRVQASVAADATYTFRRWSYEPALYARLGRRMSTERYRSLVRSTAREVRAAARRADVLQFTEGIGHLALRDNAHRLSIMERRHVHHALLQAQIETWGGFPTVAVREPIPDLLEEEYAAADRIVVYSDAARRTFLERGYDPSKLVTVHRGVTPLPTVADVTRDPTLAIYVGRADVDKGLDVAVGAIQKLGGRTRLVVAGPLTAQAREWLADQRHVEHVGILGRQELARLYARATLLLQPSVESFGLAMTDAASAGVRVLCLPTAGIGPELGADISRVLPTRDVDDWAEAVSEEIERESDESRLHRASTQTIVERFSWANSEAAMYALHREMRATLS